MTATTINTQLEKTGGRPSGFDYMRIGLALAVTAYHTISVCYGLDADNPIWRPRSPLRPFFCFLIPSFFALSGFLVAGSLFRNSIPAFLTHRAARIFPALFCEIVISAFIVGPMLTSYAIGTYFSDPQFYSYLLNILGDIHFSLPGLFHNHPFPDMVNLQLWTIPYELQCYILITALSLLRIVQKPRLLIAVLCAATFAAYAYSAWWAGFDQTHIGPSGRLCVLSFLAGVLMYILRDRIPYNATFLLVALATFFFLTEKMEMEYFSALPIAYVTVWLGLQNPKKLFFIAGADYSYGLYLYGYAIHQTVYAIFPFGHFWYVNLMMTLIISGIAAYLSWNLLEIRILEKRSIAAARVDSAGTKMKVAAGSKLPRGLFVLWEHLLGIGDVVDHYLGMVEKILCKLYHTC